MSEFDVNSPEADLPSLPSTDGVQDPVVKKFLQAVKESIEIRSGQRPKAPQLDRAVTFRDLYKYQLATFRINGELVSNPNPDGAVNTPGGSSGGNSSGGTGEDLTIPGSPVEFVATGTKLSVLLEWQAAPENIAYTEIWRAEVNNLALAVMVGATEASIYADIINEAGRTFYYWIRFVNRGGVPGNYNDDLGTVATTGQIGSAEILSMDGAKIIDATILNAKISSVSADKITTGVLNATESISVGNSTSRVHIGGAGFIRSGGAVDFMNGSGWYFDNPDGAGRMFVGNGTYYIAWNGSQMAIEANNFSLTPNSFTFNGTGTFAGALAAATGTFAGSLQAASGTFGGELIAATGSFGGRLLAGVLDLSAFGGEYHSYTVPGNYSVTVPTGKTTMRITVCGGGGGGAGIRTDGFYMGGGGGGGCMPTVVEFNNRVPGTVYNIVVGAGGVRGNNFQNGGNGAPSSVEGLLTSAFGYGGQIGNSSLNYAPGGAGGNAAGAGANGYADSEDDGFGRTIYYSNGGIGGTGTVKGGRGASAVNFSITDNSVAGGNGFVIVEFYNPNSVVLQTDYNKLISALQRQGLQTV